MITVTVLVNREQSLTIKRLTPKRKREKLKAMHARVVKFTESEYASLAEDLADFHDCTIFGVEENAERLVFALAGFYDWQRRKYTNSIALLYLKKSEPALLGLEGIAHARVLRLSIDPAAKQLTLLVPDREIAVSFDPSHAAVIMLD